MSKEEYVIKLIKATRKQTKANEDFDRALVAARVAGVEWDVIAGAVGCSRSRVIYLARRANGGVLPMPG